jgi:hypothetical protein
MIIRFGIGSTAAVACSSEGWNEPSVSAKDTAVEQLLNSQEGLCYNLDTDTYLIGDKFIAKATDLLAY